MTARPTTGSTSSATRSSGTACARRSREPVEPGGRIDGRRRACARRSRPGPTGSRSTSSRSTASGSRRSATTPLELRRVGRGSSGARSPCAAPTRARSTGSRSRRARGEAEAVAWLGPARARADWSRRSSTRTPRATRSSAARSSPRAAALGAALARPPWAPGGGRNPGFEHPLLCPSALVELELEPRELHGLPARAAARRRDLGATTARIARQISTAIRSSTRLNTQAPSTSATTRRHARGRRRPRAPAPSRSTAARGSPRTAGVSGFAPVQEVDSHGCARPAGRAVERVEHRRQEEPRQEQRLDDELDVAEDDVERRHRQRRARRRSATSGTASSGRDPEGVARLRDDARSRTISTASITPKVTSCVRDDRERHELAREAHLADEVRVVEHRPRAAFCSDVAKNIQTTSPESRNSA